MKKILFSAALACLGTAAHATSVDFEGLVATPTNFPSPPGLTVDGLTFSTTGVGLTPVIRIFTSNAPRTDFILACDFGLSGSPCAGTTLLVDFGAPVDSLSLHILSVDNPTALVTASFSGAGGSSLGTFSQSVTSAVARNPVSFSGLGGATSVEISNDDAAGVGFDGFSVVFASGGGGSGPVTPPVIPLPAGLPLLLGALGFGALVARRGKGA